MLETRVIPCLLLSGRGLVKTERFQNPKYVGDPINAVKIFNEKEVDELLLLDISVRRDRRLIQFEWIEEIVTEAFMPVGYGGGVRTIEDIRRLFDLGVEKVVLNTAVFDSPDLVRLAVQEYGSQSIVGSVDVARNWMGRRVVRVDCGRRKVGMTLEEYIDTTVSLGVGEVILTSIEREGTFKGYDLELVKLVSDRLSVPMVANGGAASFSDFKKAKEAGASAVAAGSLFVFHGKYRAVLISYPPMDMLEGLNL